MNVSFENLKRDGDQVITDNVGLAILMGREFCQSRPWDEDDMASEALLALTAEIRRLTKHPEACAEITNPSAYLRSAIHRHLVRATSRSSQFDEVESYTESAIDDQDLNASATLNELIDMCECEEDVKVVKLRAQGYTNREISERSGLPKSKVQRICQNLRDQYLAC